MPARPKQGGKGDKRRKLTERKRWAENGKNKGGLKGGE
jgi:hypothetical protein